MTTIIDLAGAWILRDAGRPYEAFPAAVPGCVHLDLQAAGRIPDLFWRDNERAIHWVAARDWVYERTVDLEARHLQAHDLTLACDGLDTLAELSWNGEPLASADNMFRRWRFSIKGRARVGTNRLAIRFRSPLPVMRAGQRRCPQYAWNTFDERYAGAAWLRKMPCSFGWDWGPMAPSCGVWRGIRIEARSAARIDHLRIDQDHGEGRVILGVQAAVERFSEAALSLRVELRDDEVVLATAESPIRDGGARLDLALDDPPLWWPRGLGEPRLLALSAELRRDDETVDRWQGRIGLRTIALIQERDARGQSFAFAVNGRRFFAKGANWIPADIFPVRADADRLRGLLEQAAGAHMNMIRCWGGGIYEDTAFYQACDELGLLVWQDFMFACSTYPAHEESFLENVRAEAVDQVRRLRHHACLALWCGNNEIEQGLVAEERDGEHMGWGEYRALFDDLLPEVLAAEDPGRSYIPGSPHTPVGDRSRANDPSSGDAHCWDCWHGGQPFEAQQAWRHRFISEFGFQSFPEPRSVAAFTRPEDRSFDSPVLAFHQRSLERGNPAIEAAMGDWFRPPRSFDEKLWLSQLTQALCIQQAVEHARRQAATEGIIFWQLNDLWPAATWSAIDVYGRPKALLFLARRFFEPLHVNGILVDGKAAIFASNHHPRAVEASLRWRLTTTAGATLIEGLETHVLGENETRPAALVDPGPWLEEPGPEGLMLWLALEAVGEVRSRNLVLFARPKALNLSAPAIDVSVSEDGDGGFVLDLSADRPALWLRLELADRDARFSDNFLHLDGHEARRIRVRPASLLTAEELKRRLRLTSLIDTA